MAFTKKNLSELENVAPKFGMPEGMAAHFPRRDLGLESVGFGYMKLAPGFRIPFGHRHGEQEEVYVVVRGSGRVKVDDEIVDLEVGDVLRVEAGTMRNFEGGPQGIEYVAFAAGDAELAKTDAEMVPGWWAD
jgi:mannose-6-phosphate isomerase-like protein (cupin superfamily)